MLVIRFRAPEDEGFGDGGAEGAGQVVTKDAVVVLEHPLPVEGFGIQGFGAEGWSVGQVVVPAASLDIRCLSRFSENTGFLTVFRS
jgi:hypothetical protein